MGMKDLLAHFGLDENKYVFPNQVCRACGKPVLVQIFKGRGWCSDDCRKKLEGDG